MSVLPNSFLEIVKLFSAFNSPATRRPCGLCHSKTLYSEVKTRRHQGSFSQVEAPHEKPQKRIKSNPLIKSQTKKTADTLGGFLFSHTQKLIDFLGPSSTGLLLGGQKILNFPPSKIETGLIF